MEQLSTEELRHLAIDVILLNRQYVDEAESLFGEIGSAEIDGTTPAGLVELCRAYRVAMMRSHAFRYVVASVLDVLGYVPDIDVPSAN